MTTTRPGPTSFSANSTSPRRRVNGEQTVRSPVEPPAEPCLETGCTGFGEPCTSGLRNRVACHTSDAGPVDANPDNSATKTGAPRGNANAVKAGAHSVSIYAPIASERLAELYEDDPWLDSPRFRGQAEELATVEARASLLAAWLDRNGGWWDRRNGAPKSGASFLLKLMAVADAKRRELGLTPKGALELVRAGVGAGASPGLEQLKAEGQRIAEARTLREGAA